MRCVCTRTCQFRGITFEGEERELKAEEFERPFVKAHFRAVAPDGAGAGKAPGFEGVATARGRRAKTSPNLELA